MNGEERKNDWDDGIIGYCKSCLSEIYSYDAYIVFNDDKYHIECYEIEHRYYDPYELDET